MYSISTLTWCNLQLYPFLVKILSKFSKFSSQAVGKLLRVIKPLNNSLPFSLEYIRVYQRDGVCHHLRYGENLLLGLQTAVQRHNTENSKQSAYFNAGKHEDRSWEYINRSQTLEWKLGLHFHFSEYINGIFSCSAHNWRWVSTTYSRNSWGVPYLDNWEAGLCDGLADEGEDLGGELPLLLP
jgi:hypothetical protein